MAFVFQIRPLTTMIKIGKEKQLWLIRKFNLILFFENTGKVIVCRIEILPEIIKIYLQYRFQDLLVGNDVFDKAIGPAQVRLCCYYGGKKCVLLLMKQHFLDTLYPTALRR